MLLSKKSLTARIARFRAIRFVGKSRCIAGQRVVVGRLYPTRDWEIRAEAVTIRGFSKFFPPGRAWMHFLLDINKKSCLIAINMKVSGAF